MSFFTQLTLRPTSPSHTFRYTQLREDIHALGINPDHPMLPLSPTKAMRGEFPQTPPESPSRPPHTEDHDKKSLLMAETHTPPPPAPKAPPKVHATIKEKVKVTLPTPEEPVSPSRATSPSRVASQPRAKERPPNSAVQGPPASADKKAALNRSNTVGRQEPGPMLLGKDRVVTEPKKEEKTGHQRLQVVPCEHMT